jgi:DUF971 family protein
MAILVPTTVMFIGTDLAVVWEDGREDYLGLEMLRRNCPCAQCKGEGDLLGNIHRGPRRPLTEASFRPRSHRRVGGYALQIDWADGHNDGIFTFESLRRMGDEAERKG